MCRGLILSLAECTHNKSLPALWFQKAAGRSQRITLSSLHEHVPIWSVSHVLPSYTSGCPCMPQAWGDVVLTTMTMLYTIYISKHSKKKLHSLFMRSQYLKNAQNVFFVVVFVCVCLWKTGSKQYHFCLKWQTTKHLSATNIRMHYSQ